ncbi:unnamed protein product [Paramecium sonneborni]|uniref:MORN repeat protein n=1 Tax=Paramecium sonneborni TaxID=65129 RepID=A0A8S1LU45_9CILI|nr:unnamed protein product [Paramecium sonneborni]
MQQSQSYIKSDKRCDRQHDEGSDRLIAICLNPHCDKRLMCCFCYHDYHCEHVKDVKTIAQVQQMCKDSIVKFDKLQLTIMLQQKADQFKSVVQSINESVERLVQYYISDIQQLYSMMEELADSFVTLQQGNINQFTNEQCELLSTFHDERILDSIEDIANFIGQKMGIQDLLKISNDLHEKLMMLDMNILLDKNIYNEQLKKFVQCHEMKYEWIQPEFLLTRSPEVMKIVYPNEDFYIGEVKGEKKFGRGLLFNKIAQTYQYGIFREDNFVWGQQLMVDQKKRYWIKQGKWVNGKIEGKGIHALFKGEYYQGDLRSDIREGFGIMRYTTGDEYQGQWKMGQFHGKGLYKYANGDEYEGDYVQDRKEGIGSYQYKNGELYVGQFKSGLRHGSAIVKFPNGDIYTGEYVNDKKEGNGVYKYINDNIFEGTYKDGQRHGQGIYTDVENGIREIGEFVQGKQQGEHMVFKLLKDKPYCINVYDQGKLVNTKSL